MSRSKSEKRRARQTTAHSGMQGLLTVFVSLFAAAYLWPSEGAINGDGLHLSFLWLIALAGMLLWDCRQAPGIDSADTAGRWIPLRLDTSAGGLVTQGMAALLLGTWLSTWSVFHESGDRRAALNLAFDWTAIAACVWFCRRLAADPGCRRILINLLAGLSLGGAVYGIWQSQIFYAEQGSDYLQQRQILDEGTDPAEVARIQREFSRKGIPLHGAAREQFEHRLLRSSEPFGPFALANTLAGVLAAGLILIAGRLAAEWRSGKPRWGRLALPVASFCVVTWCLVLTKSRTAWAGAAVGLLVLLLAPSSRKSSASRPAVRQTVKLLGLIGAAAAALLAVGLMTGAVDREVILESPRSLRFRLFYWTGAAGVIGDAPWFGAGPGNFRQLYLAHKPVESSEAILDPHNILLDAWCFAGIIGFAGILLLTGGIVRSLETSEEPSSTPRSLPALLPGLAGCVILSLGWIWLSGGTVGRQELGLAGIVVIAGLGAVWLRPLTWAPAAPAAAAVALLVHLLGAGGLQITIMGFLLTSLAVLAAPPAASAKVCHGPGAARLFPALAAVAAGAAAAATLFWGLLPVRLAAVESGTGEQRLSIGDIGGSLAAFQLAAGADPYSPAMRQRIVEATAYFLMQRSASDRSVESPVPEEEVRQIERACRDSIRSDERAVGGKLTRARIYRQLYRLSGESQYIKKSLRDYRDIVGRHPTDAGLWVERATCAQEAGQTETALESAARAAEIEAVNQAWGHSDQYLSEAERAAVDEIINDRTE